MRDPESTLRLWRLLVWLWLAALQAGAVISAETGREILPGTEDLASRSWQTSAGLPQDTVNTILQSRNGYLWVGTHDGLARFDGVRFTVFGLEAGLQSVDISTLYEDRQGMLWIGTVGGGLSRMFNGKIETFTAASRQIPGDTITAITEDAQGRLWIGTRAGLAVWKDGKRQNDPALEPLQRHGIRTLLQGVNGAVWIATLAQGLYEFRDNRLHPRKGPAGMEKVSAYCLIADSDNQIWASVGNGTILVLEEDQWRIYDQAAGLPFAYITCFSKTADGTVWAGSLDDGLYRFEHERFVPVQKDHGLSADDIRCLCPDREGNLWVGTRTGGLNRLSRRKVIHYGSAQGLTNEFTRSITQSADGRIWVATIGGGLYEGSSNQFIRFRPETIVEQYASVESVLATRDDALWWGSYRALFCWKDGRLAGCYTNETWIGPAAVTALTEDLSGGIWAGTSEGTVAQFIDGTFKPFPRRAGRGPITALIQQTNGVLWVGSAAGGLKKLNPGATQFVTLTNGLPSNSIRSLYMDATGTLWIATAGGGLSRMKHDRITAFTPAQGVSVRTISQIVEDNHGYLWLGSGQGIYRLPKEDLNRIADEKLLFVHPRVYGVHDGMAAEECSSGFFPAGLKTRSGLVCFSTVKGLVLADPDRQEPDAPAPPVLIEEILLNGKMYSQDSAASQPAEQRTITVPPGTGELQLHYTAISFAAPEKVNFRYRLGGFDRDWVEAGTRRTAYYPRLPAGKYSFRVMASNADGAWNQQGATVAVVVTPWLWERPWFLALATVGLAAGLAGLLRWTEQRRFQRRLVELQTQHAIQKERLRIAQDMHDQIGGILTQVSLLSDLGENQASAQPPVLAQFKRIGTQTRAAVQGLDEIIWATNPKNDNLPRLTDYVSQFADEFLENTTIRCWQDLPTDIPHLPIGADTRHNVFLAIREAFHNVVKHSGATEVWLRLVVNANEAVIEVEDNGKGFDPAGTRSIGNGLENMRTRLQEVRGRAEVRSAPGEGTRLRFAFPLGTQPGL